ncbi:NAD(+)/NADH kinase [soil metagenome]
MVPERVTRRHRAGYADMRATLVVHDGRAEVMAFARQLAATARSHGLEIRGDDGVRPIAGVEDFNSDRPDVVVAVGGDGTMLAAVQVALLHEAPVVGFNLGTIGFLTEAEPSQLDEVVAILASGKFATVPRLGIAATLGQATARGLNDVVVEKIDSLRLVHLAVEIDGDPFVTYRADGLIVATPTGSTAYNFSAGGPLVDPSVDALLMTPVASHSLFSRTVVLSPDAVIRVTVERDRPVRVSVDKVGLGEAEEGDVVQIERAPRPIHFVRLDHGSFARAVTEKFRLR